MIRTSTDINLWPSRLEYCYDQFKTTCIRIRNDIEFGPSGYTYMCVAI